MEAITLVLTIVKVLFVLLQSVLYLVWFVLKAIFILIFAISMLLWESSVHSLYNILPSYVYGKLSRRHAPSAPYEHAAAYAHSTLGKNQIRLLQISTFRQGSIACTLQAFDISSCPPYIALSYTWGPPLPVEVIVVNGKAFRVRRSLWEFLWRTASGRLPFVEHYFWIDQICINQLDAPEKSKQVTIMGDIFKNARQVVSWLGVAQDGGDKVIARLSQGASIDNVLDDCEPIGLDVDHDHITILLNRRYFNRMWVVQEVVLAPDDWIIASGNSICQGNALMNLLQNCDYPDGMPRILGFRWSKTARSPPFDIGELLADCAVLECEHPCDKIYALLSLIRQEQSIPIDYSKRPGEVFWEMMDRWRPVSISQSEANALLAMAKRMRVKVEKGVKTGLPRAADICFTLGCDEVECEPLVTLYDHTRATTHQKLIDDPRNIDWQVVMTPPGIPVLSRVRMRIIDIRNPY
jgi:hypothetical protein